MKNYLMILTLFLGFQCFSQNFEYTIKIKEINTKKDAKDNAAPIKIAFNKREENYFSKINFDEINSCFRIASKLDIAEAKIVNILNEYGLQLISFEKVNKNN